MKDVCIKLPPRTARSFTIPLLQSPMGDFNENVFKSFNENISSIAPPQDAVSDIIRCFELTDRPHPIDTTFRSKWRLRTSKTI